MKKFFKLLVFTSVITACFGFHVFAEELSDINLSQHSENIKLSEEELDNIIVQQEREKRKSELNYIPYSSEEERYASFFGAKYDAVLDTRKDVTISDTWFTKMNYITEPFTAPVFKDLDRRYYCTDIITVSGHGTPTEVRIGCVEEDRTEDNCIGVRAEDRNSSEGDFKYVGIGRRDLSDCRLMMFIACQTTNAKENIAKYAVEHNVQAAMGWSEDIDNNYTTNWLEKFYSGLYNGNTLQQAKESADTAISIEASKTTDLQKRTGLMSLTTGNIYGNQYQKLAYTPSKQAEKVEDGVHIVQKPLYIDCKNNDMEELINYFEENVPGFDRNTCHLTQIHNNIEGENNYNLLFEKHYNGFITDEFLFVIVNDAEIKYVSSLKPYNTLAQITITSNDISEEMVEKAKEEAVKQTNTTDRVYAQTTEKRLDANYNPCILVKTTYADEGGAFWATNYVYYLES